MNAKHSNPAKLAFGITVALVAAFLIGACQRETATTAPAMPNSIVMNHPPLSGPGMIHLASAPASNPIRHIQISPIVPPF